MTLNAAQTRDEELLARIPSDGTAIGNTKLLRALQWEEQEFWDVRNRLVDRAVLEVRRGRGGSVRLIRADERPGSVLPPPFIQAEQRTARASESELYDPLARVLEEKWLKDKRVENAIVQVTAMQGSRATGGKWTRPDITVATLSTYPYVPGRHFDVISFEVKPHDSVDITSVYEALAHLRAATRAYVLMQVDEEELDKASDGLLEIAAESKKHGVGLIVFSDAADYETWDERVEAVRREPEPHRLNDFLAKQFTQEQLERVVKWFR